MSRRNSILSNIEKAQTQHALKPASLASIRRHEMRESARVEAAEEAAGMDEPEEVGGVKGMAQTIAAAAKARGFRPKQEIVISFIKNAEGEIIGARLS